MVTGLPDFPKTLPARTVVGNIGAQASLATAIPIATLSAALADASTITFIQSGTGAVTRTVQSKERDCVSAFDFMTSAQVADVIAGTKTLDVTAAVQAALNAGHDVWCPGGTYRLDSSLVAPNRFGLVIRGEYQFTKFEATFAGAILSFGSGQTRQYTTIDGITFRASGAGAGAATGISGNAGLSYVMLADIQRCLFSGTLRTGISGNFLGCDIYRCAFGSDQTASGTFKPLKLFATDAFMTTNRIFECQFNSGNDDYVIDLSWGFHFVLRGNDIEGNSSSTGVIKVTDVLGVFFEENWTETNGAVPLIKSFDGSHTADMRVCIDRNHLEGNSSGANDVVYDNTNTVAKFFTLRDNVILNYTHITQDTGPTYNTQNQCLAFWNNKINGGTSGVFSDGEGLVKYIGTPTNDNAPAGYIGEYQSNTTASPGSGLTNNTPANVLSISNLPAGDWDVWGVADYKSNAATVITSLKQGISTSGGAFGGAGTFSVFPQNVTGPAVDPCCPTPVVRISLSAATTVILVAAAAFTTNTLSVYGDIFARRVR